MKPHVRVYYTIRNPDPAHAEQVTVFDDPELRGVWLGLLLVAGRAFAGRTFDRVVIGRDDLRWITGRTKLRHALLLLQQVCDVMGYALESCSRGFDVAPMRRRRGARVASAWAPRWVVHVKNLSENQGWDSADGGPTDIPLTSDTQSTGDSAKRGADVPSGKPPTLRKITSEDFNSQTRWEALRLQAIAAGLFADGPRSRFEWFTRRLNALDFVKREGKGDPIRVFMAHLRERVDYSTTGQEDRARADVHELERAEREATAQQLELVVGPLDTVLGGR